MKNKEKAEIKINETVVMTLAGKVPMSKIIKNVSKKIAYYNFKEVLKQKAKRTFSKEFCVKKLYMTMDYF